MSCERAAECDDYAHVVRTELGELARIKTAETPSDEADLASASLGYVAYEADHPIGDAVAQAIIAALTPAAHDIALVRKEGPQRPGRDVARDKARKDQNGMTVAPAGQAQQW